MIIAFFKSKKKYETLRLSYMILINDKIKLQERNLRAELKKEIVSEGFLLLYVLNSILNGIESNEKFRFINYKISYVLIVFGNIGDIVAEINRKLPLKRVGYM